MPLDPPYSADTRAKGWRFELDLERVAQSDTWALAQPEVRPWLLMLWAVAWQQSPCGSLPSEPALIAARIGAPARFFEKHREVLLRGWKLASDGRLYHPVVTERVLEMVAYRDKAAARKAEYRAKMQESHKSPDGVPRDSTVKNDTGTGTGTGTKEKKKPSVSGRGSRLPPDWDPGESGFAFAASQGLTNGRAQAELAKFRDYWTAKAGADATKADWQATWRNWVRKAVEAAPGQRSAATADPFAGAH